MKKGYCVFIDDDKDEQEFFLHTVQEILPEVEVHLFDSGEEALMYFKQLKSELPNYLFIDLHLVRMTGIQLLEQIKKLHSLEATKVYIYSSVVPPNLLSSMDRLGVTSFIKKPVSISQMKELVTELMLHQKG